jgi:arylformamidase
MAIDYEAEYNNRARVKNYMEIFDRWAAEAKAYREARAASGGQYGIKFGPSERQTIDFFPAQTGGTQTRDSNAPLAMFIHGGWWRSLSPASFSQMAKGPNAHGVSVAVVGYDLAPQVSIAEITEQMRAASLHLWRAHKKHFIAYGHSAGGHLSACLVATDWEMLDPAVPTDLVPAGYGISGVYDATKLLTTPLNTDLKLTEGTARACSPLFWPVPAGRTFDAVVGGIESSEFLRQSRDFAEAWRQDNVATRYEAIEGANHFTVLDPLTDPDSAMTKRVVELARQTAALDR